MKKGHKVILFSFFLFIFFQGCKPSTGQIISTNKISYLGNNATSGVTYEQAVSSGATVELLGNRFSKKNYFFCGWNTWVDGTGIPYEEKACFTMGKVDVILYAQWKSIEPEVNKVSSPTFSVPQGIVTEGTVITITCLTNDATIYYTIDESIPTTASFQYENPISVLKAMTIKAIAVKDGMLNSDISTASYETNKVEDPFIFSSEQVTGGNTVLAGKNENIYIFCKTVDATIYYTLDGSEPTKDSQNCKNPGGVSCSILIANSLTIKAFAAKEGLTDSDIVNIEIIVKERVVSPVFSPESGQITYGSRVSISTPTNGAIIYYTTDNSLPTTTTTTSSSSSSSVYVTPLMINEETVLKAIAVKDGMLNSYASYGKFYDNQAPADVTNLQICVLDKNTVELNWENPVESDFNGCLVSYNNINLLLDKNQSTIRINQLTEYNYYSFIIYSIDNTGNKSFGKIVSSYAYSPAKPTIKGLQSIPKVDSILGNLYLASESIGTQFLLYNCSACDVSTTYQWYKSLDGVSWVPIGSSGKLSPSGWALASFGVTIESGINYYCVEITNDDSVAYSNVCKIECGTNVTSNIGKIYYSDGTITFDYLENKTPYGIVCNVNTDGSVKNLLALNESSTEKVWSTNSSSFYLSVNQDSITDGLVNTNNVINLSDFSSVYYPAVYYCKNYAAAGNWFIPSINELAEAMLNSVIINKSLTKLINNSVYANIFQSNVEYWSSSFWRSSTSYIETCESGGFISYGPTAPNNRCFVRCMTRLN